MTTASAGRIEIGRRPAPAAGGALGSVTVGAMIVFGIIDVAMNFLRSDLDPAANAQTRYALGEWGFLMIIGFLVMGLGSMSVVIGLGRRIAGSTASRLGLTMLVGWSFCIVAGAAVRVDPPGLLAGGGSALHTALAVTGFICASIGITSLTMAFRHDARWLSLYPLSALIAALTVTAFGFLVGSSMIDGPGTLFPLSQRAVILGIALWLMLVGGELRKEWG